jgi:hypothetical protein
VVRFQRTFHPCFCFSASVQETNKEVEPPTEDTKLTDGEKKEEGFCDRPCAATTKVFLYIIGGVRTAHLLGVDSAAVRVQSVTAGRWLPWFTRDAISLFGLCPYPATKH